MKIREVAKLSGVTVRTLHYYDEVGILKPSEVTESGYRIYSNENLQTLQQILFFRELHFSLNEIREIMNNPNYDKAEALSKQRELLVQKRERMDGLINLIDKTIKGERNMSFKEFDMKEIEANKKKYVKEVKERFGDTDAYKECNEKTSSYNEDKWKAVTEEGNKIFKEFSACRGLEPSDKKVQSLVLKWQNHITNNFYNCTKEILAGLGLMYIQDERFKNNIDISGEGTAEFMSKAIELYCSKE